MKDTKSLHTKIELTVLEDHNSLWEFLSHVFFISKTFAKNFYSSKELERVVKAKSVLSLPINLLNRGMISPDFKGSLPIILFEDADILALSKPSGLHIHPLSYDEGDNLLSYLRQVGKSEVLQVNRENYDRGILYRLDYETSGVVLCAKREEIYQEVRQDFLSKAKSKKYLAIVEGKLEGESKLTHFLRSVEGGKKMALSKNEGEGLFSCLTYHSLQYQESIQCSLVEVELESGHRHQIRVQLAALGHPILGDTLYGGKVAKRLYLHAYDYRLELQSKMIEVKDSNISEFRELFQIDF